MTPCHTWKEATEYGLTLSPTFLPRRYVPPNGYVNPAAMSTLASSNIMPILTGQGNDVDAASGCASAILFNERIPTYFIGPEFAEAVNMTKPPPEMTVAEVKWPAQAALFCLPEATSRQIFGYHLPFISYSLVPQGRVKFMGNDLPDVYVLADCFIVKAPALVDGTIIMYYHKLPLRELVATKQDHMEVEDGCLLNRAEFPTLPNEPELLDKIRSFTLKLVLLMTSRPAMVETGGCARPAKVKNGQVVRTELWNPNFLGRIYRHPAPPQGGTHASPRVHFRRGHLHTFLTGKGRSSSVVHWVEPRWINL